MPIRYLYPIGAAIITNTVACGIAVKVSCSNNSGISIRPMGLPLVLLVVTFFGIITTLIISRSVIYKSAIGRSVPLLCVGLCVIAISLSFLPLPLAEFVFRKICIWRGIVIEG